MKSWKWNTRFNSDQFWAFTMEFCCGSYSKLVSCVEVLKMVTITLTMGHLLSRINWHNWTQPHTYLPAGYTLIWAVAVTMVTRNRWAKESLMKKLDQQWLLYAAWWGQRWTGLIKLFPMVKSKFFLVINFI